MSFNVPCKCDERKKPVGERRWLVHQRHCNHSKFNGGHYTPSNYSEVRCEKCLGVWRTKARYVNQLKDAALEYAPAAGRKEIEG